MVAGACLLPNAPEKDVWQWGPNDLRHSPVHNAPGLKVLLQMCAELTMLSMPLMLSPGPTEP